MQSESAVQLVGKENVSCPGDGSYSTFKSKIPLPVKVKPVPDFEKIHQSFQNKFQKGKAVKKRACTRPCPFNLTQKGDRFQLQPVTDVGPQALPEPERPPNALKSSCPRGPLLENRLDVKHGATAKGFKADPVALASILSNKGVSISAMGTNRAASLVQRVPSVRASAYVSCGSSVPRMESLFPPGHAGWTNKEQGSQQIEDLKPMLPSRQLLSLLMEMGSAAQPLTESQPHLTGAVPSRTGDETGGNEGHCEGGQEGSGERRAAGGGSSGAAGEGHGSSDGRPEAQSAPADGLVAPAPSTCTAAPKGAKLLDPVASTPGEDSKDFVPDLAALASILSNTGLTSSTVAGRKTSLAQRVPVKARGATSLYSANSSSMVSRGSLFGQRMNFAPKVNSGRMSRLEFKGAEMRGTPLRVPQPSMTTLPASSAQRVSIQHPLNPCPRTSSQRPPVFPKTLQTQATGVDSQQTPFQRCRRWADAPSPQSLASSMGTEDEDCVGLPMEKIAVQLFADDVGDATGDSEQVAGALPFVDVCQEISKLKRIELLARLLQKEMADIAQPESGSQDLGIFLPAHKIQSDRDLPVTSQTLPQQEGAVGGSKQRFVPCQPDRPEEDSRHGTLLHTIPVYTSSLNGGHTVRLQDTGGSSTDKSIVPPCCSLPTLASDTFKGLDSTQKALYSSLAPQPPVSSLTLNPVSRSLVLLPVDGAVPSPMFRVPTTSHIMKQRLYRLATSSQRFMDSCLDDECAFYTSRVANHLQDNRLHAQAGCQNPVARTLECQEALCFIPIAHGEI
ncbi:tastin isoform X2 [Rhinatrema bivittatum]|uniref:tastin isoform X2 n=1 Tax=Rhinatrema bivittatum TaxID=194408 RepID=UPI00112BE74C|nr:tastin isoform X2 [Rhinatrema bivittatum]